MTDNDSDSELTEDEVASEIDAMESAIEELEALTEEDVFLDRETETHHSLPDKIGTAIIYPDLVCVSSGRFHVHRNDDTIEIYEILDRIGGAPEDVDADRIDEGDTTCRVGVHGGKTHVLRELGSIDPPSVGWDADISEISTDIFRGYR